MRIPTELLELLGESCRVILLQHTEGLTEYALLKLLRNPPYCLLPKLELDDHLGLFQSHFLLFHALYRMRDACWHERSGHLVITPLQIRLLPYRDGEVALGLTDPLRDYYLDLAQLDTIGVVEVAEMLAGFWRQLARQEGREAALELMGLEEPASAAAIRHRYRQLAREFHPDRGGETKKMQALNAALALLLRDTP